MYILYNKHIPTIHLTKLNLKNINTDTYYAYKIKSHIVFIRVIYITIPQKKKI